MTTVAPIWAWRHPKPKLVSGLCVGQTDVPVDKRKVKRLAHRIRREARLHGLPRVIYTSYLLRSRLVGLQLRAWGWRHVVDEALAEASFGRWDGQPWSAIARSEVDAWVDDFLHHAPGGGESLQDVLTRARIWQTINGKGPCLMVGHGGWMLARQWAMQHPDRTPKARDWPGAPAYGECWRLS